jgi:hypothetical protein
MKPKYPQSMTFTQWRRTPVRAKHRLVGLMLNDRFGYWRSCADARCRRARHCQDHQCYWRRLQALPDKERSRIRDAAAPVAKLLWIGSSKGAEGLWQY